MIRLYGCELRTNLTAGMLFGIPIIPSYKWQVAHGQLERLELNKLNNLSDSNNSSGWVLVTNRVTGWAKNKVCSTNRQANGASKRLNNLTTHFIFTSHLTARHVNLPLVSIQSVWTTEWFECFGRNDSKGMVRHRADELLASTGWLMFRNATEFRRSSE